MSTRTRKTNHQTGNMPAIGQSELSFQTLIEHSVDAIALVDSRGKVLYLSPSIEHLSGYTAEEMGGQVAFEFVHPDDQARMMAALAGVLQEPGTSLMVEYRFQHKDGSWRWMEATATNLLHDPGIGAIVSNFHDITERKRVEERQRLLNEASEKLASSLNHRLTLQEIAQMIVPTLADYCRIAILDERQQIKDIAAHHIEPEKIALVRELYEQYKDRASSTHGIQKLLQTEKAELISIVTPEMLAPIGQENADVLAIVHALGLQSYMGTPLIARNRVIGAITFSSVQPHRHYTQEDLLFAHELARRIALTLDNARLYQQAQEEIAERKQLEAQLERSKEQLEAMLKTIADGILLQDATGKILYANQAVATLSGYQSVDELLQAPALTYQEQFEVTDEHGEPFPIANFPGRRVLAGEAQATVTVRAHKKGSEEVRWLMITSTAVVDRDSRPWAVMSVVHDITQFKELEQRKDEFIGMASHELKTPLTSLKGFLHLLQRHLSKQSDEQGLAYIAITDRQVNRLTQLVADLLDISRIQTGKLGYHEEGFDVDDLVKEIVGMMQEITPGRHLLLEGQTQAQVYGDRERIGQVLINLLTNAVRYSPQTEKVLVRVAEDQERVIVSIKDFGPGIAKEHQQKIFERFYQVNDAKYRPASGLGIGLYLSHVIIKRHNGSLWVDSEIGQGSTFHFALPLHKEQETTTLTTEL